jgi:hypothetical protein
MFLSHREHTVSPLQGPVGSSCLGQLSVVILKSYETHTPCNKMECFLSIEQTGHVITTGLWIMQYCRPYTRTHCDSLKHGVQRATKTVKPTAVSQPLRFFSFVDNSENYGREGRTWNMCFISFYRYFSERFPFIWKFGEFREETLVDMLLVLVTFVRFWLGVCGQILLQNALI